MKKHSNLETTRSNWYLPILAISFSVLALINLYSATQSSLISGVSSLFYHQLIYVIVGILLMFLFSFFDYKKIEYFSYHTYVLNIILLILVLLIGKKIYGSKRWLDLWFFNMQPSEFMKISLVLALSRFMNNDNRVGKYDFKTLIAPLLITIVPFITIVLEPDLGTALILFFITFSLIFLIGIKTKTIWILVAVMAISLPTVYMYGLKPYQKKRVMTFMDPSKDPRGTGYNSLQSKIAVGSGKIWGKGFRKGTQTHLNFLPEHHTDFIFSVIAEEHGFIGSIIVLMMFFVFFIFGINISQKAKDDYGRFLGLGLIFISFWHFFVNIGMILGIMPIVGVALPFFSYGGSSIITTFIAVGILQSIYRRRFMF